MDIFVKYTDSDTLHHFRTGDGEGSDPASFRASVFNGRRDVQMFDADGAELDVTVQEAPAAVEEVVAPAPTIRGATAARGADWVRWGPPTVRSWRRPTWAAAGTGGGA